MSAWTQFLLAFAVAVALGVLTELVQFVVKRDPSWVDVRSDVFGAAAFLGVAAAFDRRFSSTCRVGGMAVAIVLLVLHSIPLVTMMRAYALRESIFPVLAEFQSPRSQYFVNRQGTLVSIEALPAQYADSGDEKALRVKFLPGDWPGVDLYEPSPDWRGHQSLTLDIVNPTDEPLSLTLRTHDVHHNNAFEDRFNRRFEVDPHTRANVRMPMAEIEAAPHGRQMDLQHMADVLIFRNQGSRAAEMYLVAVRLEPSPRTGP